jgi:amidase/aspartyl-tRNA(Asn)/glutamyl-tRNA(Gln) amidotransferase subunit A
MHDDLTDARRKVVSRQASALEQIELSVAAALSPSCADAFIATSFDEARAVARRVDHVVAAGGDAGPLAGLAVSIKDLFDVAGEVTAAGSTILASSAAATADAPSVARLRRAGAAFIGRSNMSEFAFSGVGINPHYGMPANAATARLGGPARAPGGSTSGGATSVAGGAAWIGLGSDTGGSIRIPAALQGVVGFKGTARLVPIEGAVPLSPTLDTVSAMTRSVRDAIVVHEILADRRVVLAGRPVESLHLAVPRTLMLDALDATVARAFARSLERLSARGARIEEITLPLLGQATTINAAGGFPAAESWAWHRRLLAAHEAEYDPRVARRIRRGEAMSAADYIDLVAARRRWISRMEAALAGFDALLSPTVPMVAPEVAPLLASDETFFAVNGALLRNPSLINLLDGCALSLPCHQAGELPAGLMVWHAALHDDAVLDASLAIEAALRLPRDDSAPR